MIDEIIGDIQRASRHDDEFSGMSKTRAALRQRDHVRHCGTSSVAGHCGSIHPDFYRWQNTGLSAVRD